MAGEIEAQVGNDHANLTTELICAERALVSLRQLLTTVLTAIVGGIIGSLMTFSRLTHELAPHEDTAGRVATHELVILNERGTTVARLGPSEAGIALRFMAADGKPLLEIGVAQKGNAKFIHFFQGERVVAALNSLPPNGESTLYLGDERWEAREILGALRPDTDQGTAGIDEWGLQLREPRRDAQDRERERPRLDISAIARTPHEPRPQVKAAPATNNEPPKRSRARQQAGTRRKQTRLQSANADNREAKAPKGLQP